MKLSMKAVWATLASVALMSCGGGGGSGSSGGFTPQGFVVTVTAASGQSTPSSLVGVTVRATNSSGVAMADGTQVRLQVSPSGVGLVSTGQTTTGGPNSPIALADSVTANLSGGVANFRLHTRSVGTAVLTASVSDPSAPNRTITGSANVAVQAGPPNDNRLTLSAQATTIPIVPATLSFNGSVYPGSPYVTQITLTQRRLDGTLVNGTASSSGTGSQFCDGGTGAAAAVAGPLDYAALWLPAEGIEKDTTTTPPTFNIRLCRSITLGVNSGVSQFYVTAGYNPGTLNINVSATDPNTGETLSAIQTITIAAGTPALPASVGIFPDGFPVYIQGVNGNHATRVELDVFDGAGVLIPNPSAGVNNVQLEIVGGAQGGEILSAVNGAGVPVSGSLIKTRTINGIAAPSYQAGTRLGTVVLKATADRADNNVDNGIQDPVTSTRALTVSDGKLFDIDITNQAQAFVSGAASGTQNGAYKLLITAVATDRGGNPVVAGTEIRFGLIDSPLSGGTFAIAGNDGDPQEAGTLFTASTGAFTTAGGGAGPGDTLVVFGEEVTGNRDLEGARTIQNVLSATQLLVTSRFNNNDDTGSSVNSLGILPYVIGRAVDGNITSSAQTVTTSDGRQAVVTANLTYSSSKVGRPVIVWAQGAGDIVNGTPELVADVERLRYPGFGTVTLTAQPESIKPNISVGIRVCAQDSGATPLVGAQIRFSFSNLVGTGQGTNGGTGSVDGVSTSGPVGSLTDASGCVNVTAVTAGLINGTPQPTLNFTLENAVPAVVKIEQLGGFTITAQPSPLIVGANGVFPEIICVTGPGGPIPGVQVAGVCSASGPPGATAFVTNPIALTGVSGCTSASVTVTNFIQPVVPATVPPTVILGAGSCVFTLSGTGTNVTVPIQASRFCNDGFSPAVPCLP